MNILSIVAFEIGESAVPTAGKFSLVTVITPSFCDTAETYFPVSAVSVLSRLLIAVVILLPTFVLVSKSESFVS